MRLLRIIATTLLLAAPFTGAPAAAAKPSFATPDGFDRLAVYMSNGAFDLNEPHPQVPGCFQLRCDLRYFHEEILGWTPTESLAEELAARAFFAQRFGLDVKQLEADGRLSLQGAYGDPRIGYRLFHLAGKKVPSSGWELHDGSYMAIVTDPAGIELGGEFTGVRLPAGGHVVYGIYNVRTTLPNGDPAGEIVIRFKSLTPIVVNADGTAMFRCELEHPDWGAGLAQGTFWSQFLPDGRTRVSIRNILTFPGLGE